MSVQFSLKSQGSKRDVRGDRSLNQILLRIGFDDDTILGQLLLHQNHLLRPLDDKVSSRVQRALGHRRQFRLALSRQDTLVTPQHDGQSPNLDTLRNNFLLPPRVLDVDVDGGRVAEIPQPAFVGSDALVDGVLVGSFGRSNSDVEVFEVEVRVNVAGDSRVRSEDGLKIDVDKVVERIEMLLN